MLALFQRLSYRDRIIAGMAVALWLAALTDIPIALLATPPNTGIAIVAAVMVIIISVVFVLIFKGYARLGGLIIAAGVLAGLLVVLPPQTNVVAGMDVTYFLPVLIAGISGGSWAVVAFGSAVVILTVTLSSLAGQMAFSDALLVTSGGIVCTFLLWLLLRLLERNIHVAEHEKHIARDAERHAVESNTELSQALLDLRARNDEVSRLYDTLSDLEIPVIPLMQGVLISPLVGHLDTMRMERLSDHILSLVHSYRAKTVLLDITGVPTFDTAVAQRIIQLVQSLRLLGTNVSLTGIRAETAALIAHLGIEFPASVKTFSSLEQGVMHTLKSRTPQMS